MAVNDGEPVEVLLDWLGETGVYWPMLMDNPTIDPGCSRYPEGIFSLANYLRTRMGTPGDGPFPLQVVIGADRKMAYFQRKYYPVKLLAAVEKAVTEAKSYVAPSKPIDDGDSSNGCQLSPKADNSTPMGLLLWVIMLLLSIRFTALNPANKAQKKRT